MGQFLSLRTLIFWQGSETMAKNERRGERKVRRQAFQRMRLGHYIIFTDTKETEKNYLTGLKNNMENPENLRIEVIKARPNELVSKCLEKTALATNNAQPWIVLDRDQLESFDSIIESAKANGIAVGWSNPCIEVWFFAYFKKIPTVIDSVSCCKKFASVFKLKANQSYDKADPDITDKLRKFGDETKAIAYAKSRIESCTNNLPSGMISCTTLHELVAEIEEYNHKI